ncbi:GtrA family protein [Cellulomonas endometrii]|uniref:GtrA family protein n=1 Tax=Cellulomonas endometrii TaxID=3036301 RepID=UPI0024AE63B2|nr:GtrA family protein [Cellulomonas endometrii]
MTAAKDRRRGARLRALLRDVVRFGAVGAVGYVVDVGLFNLLAYGGPHLDPTLSKLLSVAAATVVTWLGNRYFVFHERRSRTPGREAALFLLFSLLSMVIAVAPLWVSREVLGLRSPLADNIAANVVGFGLATVFRFVAYRSVVFGGRPDALGNVQGPGTAAEDSALPR